MSAAQRGRRFAAIAISALAHIGVLIAVALHAPVLFIPSEPRGPPEPIIPVLLAPRPPPAISPGVRPGPIRLHRRRLRFTPKEEPVAPLTIPEPSTPAPPRAAPVFRPAPLPEGGVKAELKTVLRHSAIGCANSEAAGLTRDEREACLEQLGRGVREAPYQRSGASPSIKSRDPLERAVARKEAERQYREARPPPGANDAMGASGQPWEVRNGPR